MTTFGFYMEGKRDGCHEDSMFRVGKYQSNAFLASTILNLFKEVERISYAYGIWGLRVRLLPYQHYNAMIGCHLKLEH